MQTEHGSVAVIYTGGTFGMVASERGYVPSTDLPARAATALQQSGRQDLPPIEWLESPWPPLNSGDLEPRFWFDLAATIARHAEAHDGFVVIHGTDTLAFTGAALSFLLAGLDRPVVVTGASRPLSEPDSDALVNLLDALQAASAPACKEVTVAFGRQLLRANRATKRHGTIDNPFSSPAFPPLATFGEAVDWQAFEPAPVPPGGGLPQAEWRGSAVALVSVYPGISGGLIRAVCGTGIGALLLEGYPAGIGPGGNADFVQAIAEAIAAGVVVAAVSQSRQGRIRLGKYAVSTPLAEAGVVGGADMTREAALAKLHLLLAQGHGAGEIARRFETDLAGEITPE